MITFTKITKRSHFSNTCISSYYFYSIDHLYRCLNDAQIRPRKSQVDPDDLTDGGGVVSAGGAGNGPTTNDGNQMPRSQSGVSLRSRRSMPSQKSVSKNSVDEQMCISAELHDLPEGSESGDSETATEVEVCLAKMLLHFLFILEMFQ